MNAWLWVLVGAVLGCMVGFSLCSWFSHERDDDDDDEMWMR